MDLTRNLEDPGILPGFANHYNPWRCVSEIQYTRKQKNSLLRLEVPDQHGDMPAASLCQEGINSMLTYGAFMSGH